MKNQTKLILLTILCAFMHFSHGQNQCGKCMVENEVYCVDTTSYYLCINGKPMTTSLQKCPKDSVCTSSAKICEPESVANPPVCNSPCNKCSANGSKYTCVSKTNFGRCIDNKVAVISSCERGSICSTDLYSKTGQICAPPCVFEFFGLSSSCVNDELPPTVSPPLTTPSVADLVDKCKADSQYGEAKKIYYVINDNECKTYIYCEKVGGNIEALLMKCVNGFYDVILKKCVPQQPAGCGDFTVTSTSIPNIQTSTTPLSTNTNTSDNTTENTTTTTETNEPVTTEVSIPTPKEPTTEENGTTSNEN